MTRTITLTKEQIDALQFSLHEIIEVYETIDYSEDQVMDQMGRDDTVSRLYEVLNKIPGDYDAEALKVTNYSEYGVVDLERVSQSLSLLGGIKMIFKINGVYHIEKKAHYTRDDEANFDRRYGKGNWIYTEAICTGLCPECGYGDPRSDCPYRDGKCIRPSLSAKK